MLHPDWSWWLGFNLFVILMVFLDMKIFHKEDKEVTVKNALIWTIIWICMAIVFNVWIYFSMGSDSAMKFLAGYIIEKSLSVDNLFVFLMIFSYFGVPGKYQQRVLSIGIIIAMLLRAIFILGGIALVTRFEWLFYVLGIFLVYIGVKMFFEVDKDEDPSKNPIVKFFTKYLKVKQGYSGHNFTVKENGKTVFTQLFLVLMVINVTDVIFAIDSVPAILAISNDPFIVYTSNIFAILGLRALYFALAGVMKMFHYLKYGLAFILSFVGVKMLVAHYYKINIEVSLGIIAGVLLISILASIIRTKIHESEGK